MAAIPAKTDPTLEAIDRAIEKRARAEKPRPYLGASSIGKPCERQLWYGFRWSLVPQFAARVLKMFADGHNGEDVQAERLRLVDGITLWTHQEDGTQFGFRSHGGHFRGHYDGVISGLLQAPKTTHVWEHKQSGEKVQKDLQKAVEANEETALATWNETYYAQAQIYMDATGLTRHYLTCATPGGRHTISVRTKLDEAAVERIKNKAQRIIASDREPMRLHTDPARLDCKWCDFSGICHGTDLPDVNCRTCMFSTPVLDGEDGAWRCDKHDRPLDYDAQRAGCGDHLYMPTMLDSFAEVAGYDDLAGFTMTNKLTGKQFQYGTSGYTSHELKAAQDKRAIGDPGVDGLRAIGGRITG